jgi:2-methylfumaryl-CoA hydratase
VPDSKSSTGKYFEDFRVGHAIKHATPRTITTGDVALHAGLVGARFAVQSSDTFAGAIGYPRAPVDDLLVFHIVFGKSVPDLSVNAVADLGYASCRFLSPVYPGDTLTAASEIIGLRETSSRKTGIIYVRTIGLKQDGGSVLDFVRWTMVQKRDERSLVLAADKVPVLPEVLEPNALGRACPPLDRAGYDLSLSGGPHRFDDYEVGERIDHRDGTTVETAEQQMAARLYQNTARVHLDAFSTRAQRFGRQLVHGGHVISLARALSFNGLANAFHLAAVNRGRHVAPLFGGDTLFAWSEVLGKAELPGRRDVGALRLRTIATSNRPCADFPDRQGDGYDPAVVLDLDYWALIPR